jgi:hypothetical protein
LAQQHQALCADAIKKAGTVSNHRLFVTRSRDFFCSQQLGYLTTIYENRFPASPNLVHPEAILSSTRQSKPLFQKSYASYAQEGTLIGVASTKNTISYAGLDSIIAYPLKARKKRNQDAA